MLKRTLQKHSQGKQTLKYDAVVGYKGSIDQMPKKLRQEVIDKFKAMFDREPTKDDIIEVDVYQSIDIRNTWRK
jgi:hypothetical protein